jgi:hypothetical protein
MRYGCLKITRYSEDNFRIWKQGNTWDSGNMGDNATWDNSKLKNKNKIEILGEKPP